MTVVNVLVLGRSLLWGVTHLRLLWWTSYAEGPPLVRMFLKCVGDDTVRRIRKIITAVHAQIAVSR